MKSQQKDWWSNRKPIREGESDGQCSCNTYARKVKGEWEYANVVFSDDGTVIEYTIFKAGKAIHWNINYDEVNDE